MNNFEKVITQVINEFTNSDVLFTINEFEDSCDTVDEIFFPDTQLSVYFEDDNFKMTWYSEFTDIELTEDDLASVITKLFGSEPKKIGRGHSWKVDDVYVVVDGNTINFLYYYSKT